MTVTLTYDDTLARVRIDATSLAAADVALVERSTDQVRWTTVRGGEAWAVTAGAFALPLYDYEFSPDLVNYYRVRGVSTAAITFVNAGSASTGSSGSRTPGAPASIVAGDLLLCLASTRNSGTGTVNTPTDWTQVLASGNVALLGKVYDGVEAMPTITFTGGAANEDTLARIAAFRNAGLPAVTSLAQLNGSAQNVAYPALTIPDDDLLVVVAGWKQDDFTSVATLSGMTEIAETSSTAGNDASQVWDYVIQTTAANIGASSFVVTGGASAISRGLVVAFAHADYLNQQAASITPTLGTDCGDSAIWLKSIARPFLNQRVTVINRNEVRMSRGARVGVFPVVGRTMPVAVSDIRTSREWTMYVQTYTQTEADNLDLILASGDTLLVQVPGECTSVPAGYVAVGDVDTVNHPLRPLRKTWTLPMTEVATPGPDVVGAQSTWQSVVNTYATWADVLLDKATWADLLELVGSPSDVIVP